MGILKAKPSFLVYLKKMLVNFENVEKYPFIYYGLYKKKPNIITNY